MSKASSREFEAFKKEFTKWQKLFGLTGYKCYFEHIPLDENYAEITANQPAMVATVRLNSECLAGRSVKQSAKHEALHLLLWRLQDAGVNRYTTQENLYSASEEIVFKLEGLIREN